jgi:hypothetical protein
MTADAPRTLDDLARALTVERFAPPPAPAPVVDPAPVAWLDTPALVAARIAAMNAEMTPNYGHDDHLETA